MSDHDRVAAGIAAIWFGIVGSIAYVVQRIVECIRSGPVDLTLVVYSIHTSFYWRVMTASFWGGIAAIIAFSLARRASTAANAKSLRFVANGIVPLAVLLAFLAWKWP